VGVGLLFSATDSIMTATGNTNRIPISVWPTCGFRLDVWVMYEQSIWNQGSRSRSRVEGSWRSCVDLGALGVSASESKERHNNLKR
jgi:hypothetical protein